MSLEERKEASLKVIDALAHANLPAEMLASGFSAWTGLSGEMSGDAYRKGVGMLGRIFPDGLKFVVHSVTGEDDRVAVRASSTGILSDGKNYANDYHFLMEFDQNDKLRYLYEFMNVKTAFELIKPAFMALSQDQASG